MLSKNTEAALKRAYRSGKIIAYPTEAVYGLGCNPWNAEAIERLQALKKRKANKGFICIASEWEQVARWVAVPAEERMQQVFNTWPGPTTWLFAASQECPRSIIGPEEKLALRIPGHVLARKVCHVVGPLISTSANVAGELPLRTAEAVIEKYATKGVYVVKGIVGSAENVSKIVDVLTGVVHRL
ncbi:MAG: tRNA threonylcarbamoyladenosine biosynthesis protein RimN [Alphaproteobacteria bacterium]|jgi:L-threonylcarbamoyladenylate synthase|nr:tRNA threonylcarbamoyladenosine biosynthesis protein RimN [Alphaproteobacteria bacterium]